MNILQWDTLKTGLAYALTRDGYISISYPTTSFTNTHTHITPHHAHKTLCMYHIDKHTHIHNHHLQISQRCHIHTYTTLTYSVHTPHYKYILCTHTHIFTIPTIHIHTFSPLHTLLHTHTHNTYTQVPHSSLIPYYPPSHTTHIVLDKYSLTKELLKINRGKQTDKTL